MRALPLTTIQGSPFQIGKALGKLAKPAWHAHLAESERWRELQRWRGHDLVKQLMDSTRHALPDCWEELQGMSAGLGMDVDDVFLWNCRGDLLETVSEASTSVAVNRLANGQIVHKVHEEPRLRHHCHLVQVRPENGPDFISLYSPGSLPGHTFAATRAGLALTVNALACTRGSAGLPSMLLSRAMLGARSFPEALDIIMEQPRIGGAHYILAWAGEFMMLSVEATSTNRSIVPIPNKYGHANHPVHPACAAERQEIAPSSLKRHALADRLLQALPSHPGEEDILAMLNAEYEEEEGYFSKGREWPEDESSLASVFLRSAPGEIGIRIVEVQDAPPQVHRIHVTRS